MRPVAVCTLSYNLGDADFVCYQTVDAAAARRPRGSWRGVHTPPSPRLMGTCQSLARAGCGCLCSRRSCSIMTKKETKTETASSDEIVDISRRSFFTQGAAAAVGVAGLGLATAAEAAPSQMGDDHWDYDVDV